jgi:hypothetical protein
MYRVDGDAVSPLRPGERLNPGDKLYLRLKTSVAAHVYIVNEDDRGESYLLFPLPNQSLQNPLPGGRDNRLPGVRDGREMYWQVTSAGGREHFLISSAPSRSRSSSGPSRHWRCPIRTNQSSARDCPNARSACCAASAVSSQVLRERKNTQR